VVRRICEKVGFASAVNAKNGIPVTLGLVEYALVFVGRIGLTGVVGLGLGTICQSVKSVMAACRTSPQSNLRRARRKCPIGYIGTP